MVQIDYVNTDIKVTTDMPSTLFDMPLTLSVVCSVNKRELWSCGLVDNSWAKFPDNIMKDVRIYDVNGIPLIERVWNVLIDGNILHKTLYFYCQEINRKPIKPNGLAIGTYDGEIGEWAPVIRDKISDAVLVEASIPQYERLCQNYISSKNITFINDVVTTDGKPIEFFEGGIGFYNSVILRVIDQWDPNPIGDFHSIVRQSSVRDSISINTIIHKMRRFDWLHLDVNGYEASLIKAIEVNDLPSLIIFKHQNLLSEEKSDINNYLTNNGYHLKEHGIWTLAIKKL